MTSLLASGPAGSTQDLTFTREGTGTLFYTARLRYAADAPRLQGLDSGFAIERDVRPTDPTAKGTTGPACDELQGRRSRPRHADVRPDEGTTLRGGDRSAARRLRAGRVVVRDDGADLANRNDTENEPSDWWLLWQTRRIRSRREATTIGYGCSRRASARVITSSPTSSARRRPAVLGRAGARRRDVRARSVRADAQRRRLTMKP